MIGTHHPAPLTAGFRRGEPHRDRAWQDELHRIVCDSAEALWAPEGLVGLSWLREQGYREATIRRFMVGFLQGQAESDPIEALAGRDGPRPIRASRGLLFPMIGPGSWYGHRGVILDDDLNTVRWAGAGSLPFEGDRPAEADGQLVPLAGSAAGHLYPHPDPTAGRPLLIVAGPLAALLAFQQIEQHAEVCEVATIIGRDGPNREVLEALAGCSALVIATETEDPADPLVRQWRERAESAKVRGLALPPGGLRAFHRAGGDLAGWARAGLKRLGIRA